MYTPHRKMNTALKGLFCDNTFMNVRTNEALTFRKSECLFTKVFFVFYREKKPGLATKQCRDFVAKLLKCSPHAAVILRSLRPSISLSLQFRPLFFTFITTRLKTLNSEERIKLNLVSFAESEYIILFLSQLYLNWKQRLWRFLHLFRLKVK